VAGGGGGVWVGLTGGGGLALSREHPGTPPCLVVRPACLTPRALTVHVCVGCGCMYSALYDLWRAVVFVCWLLTLKTNVVALSSLMLLTCRALHNGCPRRYVLVSRSHAYNDGRRLLAAFWCERKSVVAGIRGERVGGDGGVGVCLIHPAAGATLRGVRATLTWPLPVCLFLPDGKGTAHRPCPTARARVCRARTDPPAACVGCGAPPVTPPAHTGTTTRRGGGTQTPPHTPSARRAGSRAPHTARRAQPPPAPSAAGGTGKSRR